MTRQSVYKHIARGNKFRMHRATSKILSISKIRRVSDLKSMLLKKQKVQGVFI